MFKMWGPSATKRRSDESPVTRVPPTVLCLCGMLSTISERCRVHASRWTALLQTGIWEGVIYDATGQPIRYNQKNSLFFQYLCLISAHWTSSVTVSLSSMQYWWILVSWKYSLTVITSVTWGWEGKMSVQYFFYKRFFGGEGGYWVEVPNTYVSFCPLDVIIQDTPTTVLA
jgi:hypothetical protein